MVTRKFIDAEIIKLKKRVDEAREKYGYTGSPSTLRTIEHNENLIHCLEYALAHKTDVDEGYRIFSTSAKVLHAHYLEIVSSDIPMEEKFVKIEKAIQGMSYWAVRNEEKL
jgi:hypothetical protein